MAAFSWQSPSLNGSWSTAGQWTPGGGPPSSSADTADISAPSALPYTVTLDVNETIGALTLGNSQATLEIGSKQLTVTNAGGQAGTVIVTAGVISITGGTLSATGGFSVTGVGTIFGTGTLIGTIAGAGFYQAISGTLRIESAVLGSATGLQVGNNSTAVLELDSSVAAGAAITFIAGTGTLDLTDISGNLLVGFGGTIVGLTVGSSATVPTNQIDLAGLAKTNITATSLDTSTDVLTVTTSGGSFTLQLSGSYAAGTDVDWTTDGAGTGSDLFLSTIACYCRGTLILTDRGEVAVEDLAVGEEVVTFSGALRPIKWIGRRAYDGRFIAGNRALLPIVVKAGALGDGVPARDLWVSPEHSLYIDCVLVRAVHLVNGATITQAENVERVEYFHIELDAHDVVFAEGAPAETYVDCDNRLMFANGAEYAGLYPDDDRPTWEFCAPRLEWGSQELAAIRAALLERAEALGHAFDPDPDLQLIVDGAIVRPDLVVVGVYRFDIPAGSGAVSLASRSTVPAETVAASRDIRRLGVPVKRIALYDGEMSIEVWHGHAALCDGFHDNEASHRWTNGLVHLPETWLRPFPGAFTLEVHLVANEMGYRVEPPASTRVAA